MDHLQPYLHRFTHLHTTVAAAHIVPWSVSHNDDPRNGMALCRLCHWTFDEGLLGVSPRYAVLLGRQLAQSPNVAGIAVTSDPVSSRAAAVIRRRC